jgi:hypothetical protein
MTRRDYLLRMALAADRAQIQEPITPPHEPSEEYEEERALKAKNEKIQRFYAAQDAVLNAVGFLESKKVSEIENRETKWYDFGPISQILYYFLPLPLSSLRTQALVLRFLGRR